jgi:hypothetical protein
VDCGSIQHDFAKVGVFAPALAELVAPPTVRHHPERPTAMITDWRDRSPVPAAPFPSRIVVMMPSPVL